MKSKQQTTASFFIDAPLEKPRKRRLDSDSDAEEINIDMTMSADIAHVKFLREREKRKRYAERAKLLTQKMHELQSQLHETYEKMQHTEDQIAVYLKVLSRPRTVAPTPAMSANTPPGISIPSLMSPEPELFINLPARQPSPTRQPIRTMPIARAETHQPQPSHQPLPSQAPISSEAPVQAKPLRGEPIFTSIRVGQSEVALARIAEIKTTRIDRAFTRKPRLLFRSPFNSTLLTASALDSNLSFYSTETGSLLGMAQGRDHALTTFVEESCWLREDNLAIVSNAFVTKDGNKIFSPYQLALLYMPQTIVRGIPTPNPHFQLHTFHETPHERERGPSCVAASRDRIFTGGFDRSVYAWNSPPANNTPVGRAEFNGEPQKLHQLHTSAIHSIFYQQYRDEVVTGGNDQRLIVWDLQGDRAQFVEKLSLRVNTILKNPADSNLIVCQGFTEPDKQLQAQIFDRRTGTIVGTFFDNGETGKTTRYASADISLDGLYIAQGTATTNGRDCPISIFDIRMAKAAPITSIPGGHDSRVMRTCWYGESGGGSKGIASIGVDHHLVMHDVQIQSN